MSRVEKGVVRPPNEDLQHLDQRRSTTPAAGAPAAHEPNRLLRNGAAGGSASLTRLASPVSTPDNRFNVDNAKMPQPPSAIEPGTGAVPVYAFSPTGLPNRALPESDSAKKS
jgi:hypothetical protein